MKYVKITGIILAVLIVAGALIFVGFRLHLDQNDGGFARDVSNLEREARLDMVSTAKQWLGTMEGDAAHEQIIGIYNTHEPLAQGYLVKPEDNWCATYASAVAIERDLTDIIPTECGCERQIDLWENLGRWNENDNYMPLPGDYIYYAWDEGFSFGDCTGWADHVGIVVGTAGPFIKVIEGNKDDSVTYRIILRGNWQVRGYGIPDYASKIS